MPDTVLNALRNKLARYEADGEPDKVKRVKARIAELEKAPAVKAPALAMTLSPVVVTTAPVVVTPVPKPIVQKVAPKKAAKKRNK